MDIYFRLNPEGAGRNMSLFLVMRRYDCSLKQFLDERGGPLPWRVSLVVLSQILEGVTHLVDCGVAHRDLKTDNILVDLSSAGGPDFPGVVISDFGCCLADGGSLRLPFPTRHVDRGGNVALMAPEVASAKPGVFAAIDYSKADTWAVGAIAYEVFGSENPFYARRSDGALALSSGSFRWPCDLPPLPPWVPPAAAAVVRSLLNPSPRRRPTPELAATACQLLLWAPPRWTDPSLPAPSSQEVLQWLLTVTTKVMCESAFANKGRALREYG